MRRKKPPALALQKSEQKLPSFKLTDTTFLTDRSIVTGSFKLRLDNAGGFASPLAKKEFANLTLDLIEPLEELGHGTSGVVRKARDKRSGKPLALKIIHLGDREKRHMLINELKVLRKVQHEHLVNLYDCFQLDGFAYLALKYMGGGSVEQCLATYQHLAKDAGLEALGLPEATLSSLCLQALLGLDHLHRGCNLIHRDLKPANILIDSATGVAALSDFGIAKDMGDSNSLVARSFVGTAAYMAPEVSAHSRTTSNLTAAAGLSSLVASEASRSPAVSF